MSVAHPGFVRTLPLAVPVGCVALPGALRGNDHYERHGSELAQIDASVAWREHRRAPVMEGR